MASGDARPMPQKNVAYRVTFPIFDATGAILTGAGSLDSEVSKDGGTFADCTNEATEIATSSGMYYLDLTSTEMNADTVAVIVKSASGKTTPIILYPEEAGDVRVNVTQLSGDGTAADNAESFFDGTGYAGTNNVIPLVTTTTTATAVTTVNGLANNVITAAAIAADAIGASELAADAATEIGTAVWATAARTLTAGTNIVLTKGTGVTGFNDLSAAQVNSEVDTALADIHLDHLLANPYDPASKPGASDALLNEIVESDSGVARFTANALEQAPTGGSAPSAADIRTEMDTNSTKLAAIVADTNELQTDWANGGRLDLILDARASQTTADAILADTGTDGVVVASGSKSDYALSNTSIDAILNRQLTETYATDGSAPTVAQALLLIQQALVDHDLAGTTWTIRKLDGSTAAVTLTIDSATTTTQVRRTA